MNPFSLKLSKGQTLGQGPPLMVIQLPRSEHTGLSLVCVNVWGMSRDWKIRGRCPSKF